MDSKRCHLVTAKRKSTQITQMLFKNCNTAIARVSLHELRSARVRAEFGRDDEGKYLCGACWCCGTETERSVVVVTNAPAPMLHARLLESEHRLAKVIGQMICAA